LTGWLPPGRLRGMNKGNDRKVIRFEPRLMALIEAELARARANPRARQFVFAQWVRQACIDRLKHAARSRGGATSAADLADLDALPDTGWLPPSAEDAEPPPLLAPADDGGRTGRGPRAPSGDDGA
jgi:hypothetical protein